MASDSGGRSAVARIALPAACLVLAAGAMELARFDHGLREPFFWLAFVVAPVVLIFSWAGSAAWRWYGWPNVGRWAPRLAWLSASVLAGVLLGSRIREDDVRASEIRGYRLARAIDAWREGHGGAWPGRLEDVDPEPPRTRLGWFFPPPFHYDPSAKEITFPLGGGVSHMLHLQHDTSRKWERR